MKKIIAAIFWLASISWVVMAILWMIDGEWLLMFLGFFLFIVCGGIAGTIFAPNKTADGVHHMSKHCDACGKKLGFFAGRIPIGNDKTLCDNCFTEKRKTDEMQRMKQIEDFELQRKKQAEHRELQIIKDDERERAFLSCVKNLTFVSVDDTLPIIKRNVYTKMPTYAIAKFEHGLTDYIVVDVETTGLKPNTDRIIEISLVKFRSFIPIECMVSLVNPSKNIPQKASDINGITNEMVADAPMFQNIAQSIMDFIGNEKYIVAHNLTFDLEFLYCSGINTFLMNDRRYIDTLSMARNLLARNEVKRYTLSSLADYFSIPYSKRHRQHPQGSPKSLSDCIVTGFLLQRLAGVSK